MPSRLSVSRPRAASRPPAAALQRKSVRRGNPVSLGDLEDTSDWEPSNDEPEMELQEIRESIEQWEEELKARGRPVSGRTM